MQSDVMMANLPEKVYQTRICAAILGFLCWNLALPGCPRRKQMEAGTAWEAALRAARLRAGPLHRVQGMLQRVQGRAPETGALCTLDQWFVFFYIRTDSFLYLSLVPISTWSIRLMGRSSLLPLLISHMDACVRCWATSPISFPFHLFHLY